MRRSKRTARRSIGPMTDAGPSQPQVTKATTGPSSDSQGAIKKRGHTRCLEVWKMREGQRIPIPINTKGQPVGDNVNKLTNFLGTIARNGEYAPLTFTDWRAVPNEKKDDMMGLVMSKFEFDTDAKKWVLQSIGRKWKDWKCELKKLHYSPHETDEERLADLDERVKEDQWKALIQFWNSEEGRARTMTSLENRKRQLIGHAAGSKSFARIREEERRKTVSGEDPSRADVFILTHTCKSGRPVDEASLRVMEQLNERISQQPETSQNSTGRNDLFSQVMGEDRHGRVRTYGLGPTPTDLWGTTSIQRRTQSRNEEYEGLQNEVSSLKSEVSSIKSEVSSLKSEFSSFKESVAQLISSRTNLKSTVSDNSANLNPNQLASSSSQGHLAKKGKTTTCSSTGDVIEVFLTSIRGVNVARGIVLSKDPLTKVGGFPLGNGFWEVYIQVAIVREETLMRPYGRYRTIGDAAGTSICWPDCCCSVVTAMD